MTHCIVPLKSTLKELGEKETNEILSDFSCPKNKDVEAFLLSGAVALDLQSKSRTYLVYGVDDNSRTLAGYFTLSLKNISVPHTAVQRKFREKLKRFSKLQDGFYTFPLILIGQLGKNYTNEADKLINGDKLLACALDKVREAQDIIGGRFVLLECEDVPDLIEYYERNSFSCYGQRYLDSDETNLKGNYLLQWLRIT